jgi:hypothetical protein
MPPAMHTIRTLPSPSEGPHNEPVACPNPFRQTNDLSMTFGGENNQGMRFLDFES